MMPTPSVTVLKDTTANPAPLGLLGFGMTTVLLNLANAGYFGVNAMILAMGIFVGGLAQVLAGVQEWKKGNSFGATAFTAYGMFWLSLVCIFTLPATSWGGAFKADAASLGWYLLLWGVFTLFMFFGTLKLNRMLQVVFFTLTILFFLLAGSEFTENASLKAFAGYEGIVCGLSACYGSMALILNETYGRTVLPLGDKKVLPASQPEAEALPSLSA
ncbi:acetate uptake transporter [Compostibacter hankyongensis]|uniref:Acetate uptake transporter n=1 Tax=Compostibacter hankyongensis TaxID=1007089 RepID=A0ABP8FFU2_9BACT